MTTKIIFKMGLTVSIGIILLSQFLGFSASVVYNNMHNIAWYKIDSSKTDIAKSEFLSSSEFKKIKSNLKDHPKAFTKYITDTINVYNTVSDTIRMPCPIEKISPHQDYIKIKDSIIVKKVSFMRNDTAQGYIFVLDNVNPKVRVSSRIIIYSIPFSPSKINVK